MHKINELLQNFDCKPYRYTKSGRVTLVDTDNGQYVIKEKIKDNDQIFNYLKSRNFDYYPKILLRKDNYEVNEYIDEIDMPVEQKMQDMIDLVSLLHNKTTHYKEIDSADYQQIYEDISNNITYLDTYYKDIIAIIDSKEYMDPSEYLLARNISKVFSSLEYAKKELENWYNKVKDSRKKRVVVVHNNLDLSHFRRNKESYLISWDKTKLDSPVFDLYKLYKKHAIDFDFYDILKRYEQYYPLLEEEKKLFFILIALPTKLEFNDSIYNMCVKIGRELDIIYKTESLISPYYSENTIENKK